MKDGSGQVAECLPADLPPAALTQYLRAATFGLIRSGTPAPLQPMQEAPLPDGFETSESPFASEYSNRLAMGPEEVLIASQTLDGMLRLATDRERLVVQMRIEGYGAVEIAQRLGVTDRTVRRCLQALRERATKAGVIDPPPAVPSRAATDDRGARMAKATRVA